MSNYVLLNNVQHHNLKVLDRYFPAAGDHKAAVLTFPTEFANVQREYPILLSRDPQTGEFQSVALLGIQKDENLFLDVNQGAGNGWLGSYVPAIVARGPFILGFQEQSDGSRQPMVYVDMDSPKVSTAEGAPLFLEFGGNSPYLEHIKNVLVVIQQGTEVGKAMFKAFSELELIEPITVNIDLKNGDKHRLAGYHTLSEERLAKLSGANLERLNRAGYLQGAFLMLASLTNLQRLIEVKNSRL